MDNTKNVYEEPILLSAEDLEDVAGGCLFNCSDGSCRTQADQKIES